MRSLTPPHFIAINGGLGFCHSWAGQRLFSGPSGPEPVSEYAVWQTDALLPLDKSFCYATKRQTHIGAPVTMLLSICRPSAVTWLVATIIINTIKRFASRTLPHIRKEILEFKPASTHLDTASTVAIEAPCIWILAPLQHPRPYPVNRSRFSTNVMSVFRYSLFYLIPGCLCASARNSRSTSKMTSGSNCLLSAITSTEPRSLSGNAVSGRLNNYKSPESLSDKVKRGWHNVIHYTSNRSDYCKDRWELAVYRCTPADELLAKKP